MRDLVRRLSALHAPPRGVARTAVGRLRDAALPIAQTAVAAVCAWYLAVALLPTEQPAFASIAAVISLGATVGQRRKRAVELICGVVLGLSVADLIIHLIGTGPLQIGLMVVLAMSTARLLGGGELLIVEGAVSALILVALTPSDPGFSFDRVFEGLIGGAVALTVSSLFFPPDPVLRVARAAQACFGRLGRTLEEVAEALEAGDPARAERALVDSRGIDALVVSLQAELVIARETARSAPPRRGAGAELDRYERSLAQIDFAVRNTRVLARHALRYTRSRLVAPEGLPEAVGELAGAVWALAGQYDEPRREADTVRLARSAARRSALLFEREPDLALTEILAQVRSIGADLVRAGELAGAEPALPADRPTEELLAAA